MRRARIGGLSLLLCASCLPSTGVDWPADVSEISFLVRVSETGPAEIARVSPEDPALPFALGPEDAVYLIGADAESLAASYPGLSVDSSVADLRIEPGEAPEDALCTRYGTLLPLENRLHVPLMREGGLTHLDLWHFDRAGGTWLPQDDLPGAETMQLNYPRGECAAAQKGYVREPFSPSSAFEGSTNLLVPVSPTRALISDQFKVLLVDRGQGDVGAEWGVESLPPPSNKPDTPMPESSRWKIRRLTLDPADSSRALVTVRYEHQEFQKGLVEMLASAVWVLHLGDNGVVAEATPRFYTESVPGVSGGLLDLDFGPEGNWLAAGTGFVVTASSSSARGVRMDLPNLSTLVLEWASKGTEPHWLFDNSGVIWRGDVLRSPGGLRKLQAPHLRDFWASTLDETEDSPAAYVSGFGPSLGRVDETWEDVPVWLPEGAAVCGGSARQCGRLLETGDSTRRRIEALEVDPTTRSLLFALVGCSAVFVFDPEEGCTHAIPLEDTIRFQIGADNEPEDAVLPRSMALVGRQLWVGGEKGYFEVIDLE